MNWQGRRVASKERDMPIYYLNNDFIDEDDESENDIFATQILPSLYEKVDIASVIAQQLHLSDSQKEQLQMTLTGHKVLFSGKLGKYPGTKCHLTLKPNAQPIHCKPYPIPHIHEKVFQDECKRLRDEGVLEPCGATEHAYPTFIIPKKDGRVQWVSDFCKLNRMIAR